MAFAALIIDRHSNIIQLKEMVAECVDLCLFDFISSDVVLFFGSTFKQTNFVIGLL